jgi:hypothetical protein
MKYFSGRLQKEPEIRRALKRLRGLFVSKLTREELRTRPKIVFKVRHFVQCIARRIVATVDGMNLGWNADNIVTAVTMARSLIETVAVAHAVTQDLKFATREADFIKVNHVLDSAMLGSRHPTFAAAAAFEPHRVMKTIARFDREFLSSSTPVVKDHYEFLCEFVHPNGPGLLMLYSDNRYATDDISYELGAERREMIFQELVFPLHLIVVAVAFLEDLLVLLPDLERLSAADSATASKSSRKPRNA